MNSCGIELECYARAATTVQNRCSSTTKLLSDYATNRALVAQCELALTIAVA
jgi:hypothetical protein